MHRFPERLRDWSDRLRVGWHRAATRLAEAGQRLRIAVRDMRRHCRGEPLPSRPLVVAAVCLAAGCAVARAAATVAGGATEAVGVSLAAVWWGLAAAALGPWLWCMRRGRAGQAAAWMCLAIIGTGAAWSAAQFDLFSADDLAWQFPDPEASGSPAPVAIIGTVVESPRLLPVPMQDPRRAAAIGPSSECEVEVEAVRGGSRWRRAAGRTAVIVDGEPPDLRVGSRIRVLGRGLRPAPALNPGEFDFRLRSRSRRCLSIVRVPSAAGIRLLSRASPWAPGPLLDRLRTWGVGVMHAHLSESRAPLAAALLLGSRESLPREDADDFLVTGTIHILSISGLHVGLLSLALFKVLRTLLVPRRWSLVAVAVCTGLYMVLVRAETPVVRATLLVWLACLASATGRKSPAINALAVAAIVVLAWRPAEVFSAGAQLSFLSTAVLIGVSAALPRSRLPDDPIERLIERSRTRPERLLRGVGWSTWTLFVTGAAVWAATAPMVAARFHVLSPVGLVLNVVISPLVALAMAWGFLCLLFAAVSATVAGVCGAACDATLACIAGCVAWAAKVPGGHAWVAGPALWWVVGWYLLFAAALLLLPPERLKRGMTWGAIAAAWMAVGLGAAVVARLASPGPEGMQAIVAAMGHGCGIVVRSPQGRCLVYDAGRLGAPGAARRAMAAVLWSEGVSRIDTLVISHADTDHFNAVPELLERFAVGEVVASAGLCASPSPAVQDLLGRVRERGIPIRTVRTGDSFAIDPLCRVRVLLADGGRRDDGGPAADNEQSAVLAVEAAGRRLLLTGDLEGESLARFVAGDPDSCDALVAPHHGSRTSLPADIARATAPACVLVSGVGGSAWREVRAAYGEATPSGRATVLKTGGEGAIAVAFTADAIRVSRFSAGAWRPAGP